MESSVLLSNLSTSEHHLDSTEHESHPEQESGLIYRVKTTLATRFGFFSPDSLKTVSTFINLVPTEVVRMFFFASCLSCKLSPIDCLTTNTFYQFVPPVIRDRWPFSCRKRYLVIFKIVHLIGWQFQNGIKYMAYNPESRWTKNLQEVAMKHVLRTSWLS